LIGSRRLRRRLSGVRFHAVGDSCAICCKNAGEETVATSCAFEMNAVSISTAGIVA